MGKKDCGIMTKLDFKAFYIFANHKNIFSDFAHVLWEQVCWHLIHYNFDFVFRLDSTPDLTGLVTSIGFMGAPGVILEKIPSGKETTCAMECMQDLFAAGFKKGSYGGKLGKYIPTNESNAVKVVVYLWCSTSKGGTFQKLHVSHFITMIVVNVSQVLCWSVS